MAPKAPANARAARRENPPRFVAGKPFLLKCRSEPMPNGLVVDYADDLIPDKGQFR